MTILDLLKDEDLSARAGVYSSPAATRIELMLRPEIRKVREALSTGELVDEDVREWVANELMTLKRGERFPQDLAIAALAVALEQVPLAIADDLIAELSQLRIYEMPLAPRVAAECLRGRSETLPDNTWAEWTVRPELELTLASVSEWALVPGAATHSNERATIGSSLA